MRLLGLRRQVLIIWDGRTLTREQAENIIREKQAAVRRFGSIEQHHVDRAARFHDLKNKAQDEYIALQELIHDADEEARAA